MNEQIDRKLFLQLIRFVQQSIAPGIEFRNDIFLIELNAKLDVLYRLINGVSFLYDDKIVDAICVIDKGEENEP